MRIGLYIGTFNPFHIGHRLSLQTVLSDFDLQRILVIPSGCARKKSNEVSSASTDRWSLLSYALANNDRCTLISTEINCDLISYTADTLAYIRSIFPSDDLYLILGEDNAARIASWYKYDVIADLAQFIIIRRSESTSAGSFQDTKMQRNAFCGPVSDMSSSAIRNRILNGQSLSDCVDTHAEDYIYSYGLYMPKELQNEIHYIRAHQKASRFRHTIGVVKTAMKLSELFKLDSRTIIEAAYLHDIAKELPHDMMVCFASSTGTDLGCSAIEPVLHAPAGAALARTLFDIDSGVYQAILLHCTLDSEMTLVDKVIFISDMIEPSRSYPAVERLRTVFNSVRNEKDLNALLILAIELNFCYISSGGGTIHPASVRALEKLKSENT